MKNNYLVWGAVALVAVLGGYFLLQGYSKPAEVTKSQPVETVTATPTSIATTGGEVMSKVSVEYTDSGFTPKSVTVKVGETVTFVNKSKKGMWVASAVHPTHQEYPEFDQKTSVKNGESYSFTFTKPGSWKYHNHVGPSDGGTVVVQ